MLLLALAVGCCCTVAGNPKYVLDFRTGLDRVKVDNYLDKLDIRVDETEGEKTLTVTHKPHEGEDDTAWSVESERFAVTARQGFALRVRAYGNLSMLANVNWTKLRWFGADGKPLRTTDALGKEIDLTTPFGFRCEDMRFVETIVRGEVPAGASAATLFVGADTPNVNGKSRISISFVEYYEHRADEPLEFTGDFDGPTVTAYSPSACCADFRAPIEFSLADPSGVDVATLRCALDGRDVTSRVKASGGDRFRYEPETDWQEGALHEFTIEVSDRLGNRARPDAHFSYFSKEDVAHPKYVLRDDGVVLKDGKPTLPVVVCSLRKCKPNGNNLHTAVTNLLDNGFSGAHSYMSPFDTGSRGEEYREIVRLGDELGLETYFEPAPRPRTPGGKDRVAREKVLLETLKAGRRHRSATAWCLGDDAADAMTVEQLKRHYRIAKAVDPFALATSADYIGYPGRIEPYLPYADVFFAELYPFRIKGSTATSAIALVRDTYLVAIRQLQAAGRHPKSHWAIGQSFNGWGWDYYPSYEEVRLQAFLYLTMGARGLLWYTYCDGGHQWGASLDPRHWDELCRVTREVRSYERDLVSRDAQQQPRCEIVKGVRKDEAGNFPISFLLKETGLLVAVNSAGTPVTARFVFADGRTVEHRFEYAGILLTRRTTDAADISRMDRTKLQIGTYCLAKRYRDEAHVKDIRDCGVDFVYGIPADDRKTLDLCAKYGLGVIATGAVPFWHGMGGEQAGQMRQLRPLDSYAVAMEKFVDHPAIWMIDYVDEPSALDFPWIGELARFLRNKAPKGVVPYVNLYPNYASVVGNTDKQTRNQLGTKTYDEHAAAYMRDIPLDYACFDFYIYSARGEAKRKAKLETFHDNFRVLADGCRATGRSLWFIPQVNSSYGELWLSENMLRFQAHLALAYGAEVLNWACWSREKGGETVDMPGLTGWWTNNVLTLKGEKTEQYGKLKKVNAELHRLGERYMKYRNVATRRIDKGNFVVGDMVSRDGNGKRAMFVLASGDPFDERPGVQRYSFLAASARAWGCDGEIAVGKGADGTLAVDLLSNAGALIEYEPVFCGG